VTERTLAVLDLGRAEYDATWALQKRLHARLLSDPEAPDHVILVEHPPVITLGRRADRTNVLLGREELARRGVEIREIDRGGDVTYHGPGQLVAYPIFRLSGPRRDVHAYFRSLEAAVIGLLAEYGIAAGRHAGLTGVWVGDEKICAMGVAIKRWTTYHGLALNVNTNLDHFRLITPCGITDKGITSMQKELGREVPMAEVAGTLVRHFVAQFAFDRAVKADSAALS
jgi:lipoyl(octanoyl) transferase